MNPTFPQTRTCEHVYKSSWMCKDWGSKDLFLAIKFIEKQNVWVVINYEGAALDNVLYQIIAYVDWDVSNFYSWLMNLSYLAFIRTIRSTKNLMFIVSLSILDRFEKVMIMLCINLIESWFDGNDTFHMIAKNEVNFTLLASKRTKLI